MKDVKTSSNCGHRKKFFFRRPRILGPRVLVMRNIRKKFTIVQNFFFSTTVRITYTICRISQQVLRFVPQGYDRTIIVLIMYGLKEFCQHEIKLLHRRQIAVKGC